MEFTVGVRSVTFGGIKSGGRAAVKFVNSVLLILLLVSLAENVILYTPAVDGTVYELLNLYGNPVEFDNVSTSIIPPGRMMVALTTLTIVLSGTFAEIS